MLAYLVYQELVGYSMKSRQDWSRHPLVVAVLVAAAVVTIVGFFTGGQPVTSLLRSRPNEVLSEAAASATESARDVSSVKPRSSVTGEETGEPHRNPPTMLRFLGQWRGTGEQYSPRQNWTIVMDLREGTVGGAIGSITYPSLRCGGTLTLLDIDRDEVHLLEDITFGNCLDNGTIRMELTGPGVARWDWYYQDGRHGASSPNLVRSGRE